MTNRWLPWTLVPIGLACSTADASPEPSSSFDTAVATLAPTAMPSVNASVAPIQAASQPTSDSSYPRLRRTYSRDAMRLHGCARQQQDGSILGHGCPSGVVAVGPRVVAPTHSDVAIRFDIESPSGIELASDIVSDRARFIHGRLDHAISPHEKRTISYGVHVFEATSAVEARIALRSAAPFDFRITNLTFEVQ